jgi:ribosomal protein L37E
MKKQDKLGRCDRCGTAIYKVASGALCGACYMDRDRIHVITVKRAVSPWFEDELGLYRIVGDADFVPMTAKSH